MIPANIGGIMNCVIVVAVVVGKIEVLTAFLAILTAIAMVAVVMMQTVVVVVVVASHGRMNHHQEG